MQVSNRGAIVALGGMFAAVSFGVGAMSAADHRPNPSVPFGTAIARGALGGSIVGVVLASAALATPTMQHRFATSAGFIGGLAAMGALGGAGFATVRAFNHD